MITGDIIIQEALMASMVAQWRPGKGNHDCTFDVAPIQGYDKKVFRIVTHITPCTLETLDLFFSSQNTRLYEPAIVDEQELILPSSEVPEAASTLLYTKFGVQGVVSGRDFVTKHVSKIIESDFSVTAQKVLDREIPSALAGTDGKRRMFAFASKSIEDFNSVLPVPPTIVRGNVQLHCFLGFPAPSVKGVPSVKLVHMSSVDPKGSIPNFALESSWPETCAKVAKVRELLVMLENVMYSAKRRPEAFLKVLGIAPVTLSSPQPCQVALEAQPAKSELQRERGSSTSVARESVAPVAEVSTAPVVAAATPEKHLDPTNMDASTPIDQLRSEVKSEALTEGTEASPAPVVVEQRPPPVLLEARGSIDRILELHRSAAWSVSKTLENCLMEESAAPPSFQTTKKVLRISTEIRCSLGTFSDFLADSAQVRKYDPTLDKFDVLSDGPEGTTIYTSYKQQTRLVAPRDFCSTTARAFFDGDEAASQGIGACKAAFVQNSVNSTKKGPTKEFTRGIIHTFGYVALVEGAYQGDADKGAEESTVLKVYNIMCADPCGSIPNWVIEAASADACKKLALIRKLCEEKQSVKPGVVPRRLSMRRAAPPPQFCKRSQSPTAVSNTSGISQSLDSPSSAEFHSCLDETEILTEQQNLRAFYEKEVDEIVQHLILLHCAKGWVQQSFVGEVKLETLQSPICDKKAIRTSAEFLCSLDTFRTVISSMELVRKYDPQLCELETLDSPPYGTVIYTSYKSSTKLIQPRDFCTLTAAKLLTEDEGSDAGLYTKGFHAAAFVISSINSTDKPEQPGYVRGVVHAHGYIAVAVPPDANRVRVFNVALIDPKGSIPAALVDAAMSESCKKLDVIGKICKAQQEGGKVKAAQVTSLASSEQSFPAVDEMPILRKLARIHTTGEWSTMKHIGKVQFAHCHCDVDPDVTAFKFSTEIMCSVDAFARYMPNMSDNMRRVDPDLDVVKFLDGPPNAAMVYQSFLPSSKSFPSTDLIALHVNKLLTEEEGADLGLYTKNIHSSAFVMNAANWNRGVSEVAGCSRATVYYNGFIAIATPPTARRIRVFHYLALGGVSKSALAIQQKEQFAIDVSNKMVRIAALCEQFEKDLDAALKPLEAPCEGAAPCVAELPVVVAPDVVTTPAAAATSNADPIVGTKEATVDTKSAVFTPAQRSTLAKLLQLQRRRDWGMGKVIERCLLEHCVVTYCDKKALRISTDINCSLQTFNEFLGEVKHLKVYDPQLDKLEAQGSTDAGFVIYTSYKQQSRFVAPRDFCTVTFRTLLSEEQIAAEGDELAQLIPRGNCALIQNSTSVTGRALGGGNLVRGTVHVHGYIALAPSFDHPKIKVFNISCVDPSGSLPNWIIEAVNAEACKKLAIIRNLCEEIQAAKK